MWKEDEKEQLVKMWQRNDLVGFDNLIELLLTARTNASYPPYNIEKIDQENICIVFAIAGFDKEHLSVTLDGIQLTISGKKVEDSTEKEYIYKGIANRSFQKTFVLAEGMKVVNASLHNGLLKIYLNKPAPSSGAIVIPISMQ